VSPRDETPPGPPPVDATPGAAPGADAQVRALSRATERTARKVTELDRHVRQIAADLLRLTDAVFARDGASPPAADEDDPPAGPPPVRSWLLAPGDGDVDPGQVVADLAELVGWLERVYLRYPDAALAPCWLWHPHVIEELWWLRRAHADAYDRDDGSWLRVGDWHDRQRPAVARRVRDALGKCDLSLHAPGKPQGQKAAVAPLAGHAARIADAWLSRATRPEPTPAQLDEAAAYLRTLHRSLR
jgi:hypothetical protein